MNQRVLSRPRRLWLIAALALLATMAGLASPAAASRGQEAAEPEAFSTIALLNGWTNYGGGTGVAKVSLANGIVRFKGAIATDGVDPTAFVLPPGMRPNKNVYIPVDLCDAHNGRLFIRSNGSVDVQSEGAFSEAQCFTSLEGASFALTPAGQVNLALINGWSNGPFGTRAAKATNLGGIVHLSGAIETSGTSKRPFVLPPGMRPQNTAFVPIDLCGAADGRLRIGSTGTVTVQADDDFADAQCFTSLDGAHFAVNPASQTLLTLENGWTNSPFGTRKARATLVAGVVHLSGAIAGGTDTEVFTLPVGLRPTKLVYIQADLCSVTNGRFIIETDGTVTVQSELAFAAAQCFTSLDGASFAR